MKFIAAAASALVLAASAAAADPALEGRWTVDGAQSLKTLTAPGKITQQEADRIVAAFGGMTLTFGGAQVVTGLGAQAVTCAWSWAPAPRIAFSGCKDAKGMPQPKGPDHLELSGGMLLFFESDGSALAFRRG